MIHIEYIFKFLEFSDVIRLGYLCKQFKLYLLYTSKYDDKIYNSSL